MPRPLLAIRVNIPGNPGMLELGDVAATLDNVSLVHTWDWVGAGGNVGVLIVWVGAGG